MPQAEWFLGMLMVAKLAIMQFLDRYTFLLSSHVPWNEGLLLSLHADFDGGHGTTRRSRVLAYSISPEVTVDDLLTTPSSVNLILQSLLCTCFRLQVVWWLVERFIVLVHGDKALQFVIGPLRGVSYVRRPGWPKQSHDLLDPLPTCHSLHHGREPL